MVRAVCNLLGAAILLVLVFPLHAADDEQKKDDEKLLQEAKLPTTGEGLCDFFRKNTPTDADLKRVPDLVRDLGSEEFETRKRATDKIVALGPSILPLLRKDADHPDLETRLRIRGCIDKLERSSLSDQAMAAARLLRDRKPKNAVQVLLGYLPFAPSDDVGDEVVLTLFQLGVGDGTVENRLAEAWKDNSSAKRAAAILALARWGNKEQKVAAAQALKDADPTVRYRAAQGFAAAGDKSSLPVLISLLAEAPPAVAERAETLLDRLAGDGAPSVSLGADDDARKKCRAAWEEWWKKHGDDLDLAKSKVDVMQASPAELARDAVRKFIQAIDKKDTAQLEKLLDDKLNISGMTEISRDDLLKQLKAAPATPDQKISVTEIKSTKLADAVKPGAAETVKFLQVFEKERVQAVSAEITQGGRKEKAILVLRIKGSKAVISGMIEAK